MHKTWETLRTLEHTDGASTKRLKPKGAFAVGVFYAKLMFRLLFVNAPKHDAFWMPAETTKLSKDLVKSVNILTHAATFDDQDAIFLLAEMNFYGNYTHPQNYSAAFERYSQLAALNGNSTSQYMIGLMYSTGIGQAVQRDQAKALLYHTFAAEQGNTRSEMTLAFRHHAGIGTARDCDKAAQYYKRVADKAMEYWRSGPPGGNIMPKQSYRWAEESGGVYGEGASYSSAGMNANRDGTSHTNLDGVLEFLDMQERQGNLQATYSLGRHYYEGSRDRRRHLRKAQRHFMKVARAYWGKDGRVNPKAPKGIDKIAAKAAAHIGRMFLRGEGMEQSFEKAVVWFRRGIANGDALCQHHMGLMYRDGLGVPKDAVRAAAFLKTAADQDLTSAQSALGTLFLDQGDVETAVRYFELAARNGHMEAFYYLAELTDKGIGRERNCGMATTYYKIVTEKAEIIHSAFSEANTAFENGDFEEALIPTIKAAEQGYENAQANVAYLLDDQKSALSLGTLSFVPQRQEEKLRLQNAGLALIYWTRSAKQLNIDSLLKMGDYYISGQGAASNSPDFDKASTCYQRAAESHSAQALWNLGWIHENGIPPIEQDFHIAKRYYDLALEKSVEAYLPVKLALLKLRFRSWLNSIIGGKANSIKADDEQELSKNRSFSEWIAHFLEYANEQERDSGQVDDMELDSVIFGGNDPMPGGEENYDDFDEGLLESLIIIGLAATLAFLVYYRQQRQLQNQRVVEAVPGVDAQRNAAVAPGAQQQPVNIAPVPEANEGEGGFFPIPGDPDWDQWVAGGVGH